MRLSKNVYRKFVKGGSGGTPVAELWEGSESFPVRLKEPTNQFNRASSNDDSGVFASVSSAPARGGRLGEEFAERLSPRSDFWPVNVGAIEAPPDLGTPDIPAMPEIGEPEAYYAQLADEAQTNGLMHHHEAAKVGLYITLALDPGLPWSRKQKFFEHALLRHCFAPPLPSDAVWTFYQELTDLVRTHAGSEALRLASFEDDMYAARQQMGQPREKIENDADLFFQDIMGHADRCPEHFTEQDWAQLKVLRDHWI